MLVVEIVANVINQIRIVHFDGNCHEHNDFKIQLVFLHTHNIFTKGEKIKISSNFFFNESHCESLLRLSSI